MSNAPIPFNYLTNLTFFLLFELCPFLLFIRFFMILLQNERSSFHFSMTKNCISYLWIMWISSCISPFSAVFLFLFVDNFCCFFPIFLPYSSSKRIPLCIFSKAFFPLDRTNYLIILQNFIRFHILPHSGNIPPLRYTAHGRTFYLALNKNRAAVPYH